MANKWQWDKSSYWNVHVRFKSWIEDNHSAWFNNFDVHYSLCLALSRPLVRSLKQVKCYLDAANWSEPSQKFNNKNSSLTATDSSVAMWFEKDKAYTDCKHRFSLAFSFYNLIVMMWTHYFSCISLYTITFMLQLIWLQKGGKIPVILSVRIKNIWPVWLITHKNY